MIQLCLLKFHLYTDNVKDMKKYFCLVLLYVFFRKKNPIIDMKIAGVKGRVAAKRVHVPLFHG